MDKTAIVFSERDRRSGTVEDRLDPGSYVTDAQVAKVSTQGKYLAGLLSDKDL